MEEVIQIHKNTKCTTPSIVSISKYTIIMSLEIITYS